MALVIFLRGVNVGGHRTFRPSMLANELKEFGVVNVGELFRLVVDHPQFAWLHNISEFVVRIDETLTGEAKVVPADAATAVALARKMFTPTAEGDAFQKKYFDAIQDDPNVVMEHGELARVFLSEDAPGGNEKNS